MTNQFGKNIQAIDAYLKQAYNTDRIQIINMVGAEYDDKAKELTVYFIYRESGFSLPRKGTIRSISVPNDRPMFLYQLKKLLPYSS